MTTAEQNAEAIAGKLLTEFRDMPEWKRIMAREIVAEMRIELARWPELERETVASTLDALTALRDTRDVWEGAG